jgi:hypothetical protein
LKKGVVGVEITEQNLNHDPVGAIGMLKEKVYDHERFTMDEYLEHLAQSLWKFQGKGLVIQGATLEEKCESCLRQLIEYGMVIVN